MPRRAQASTTKRPMNRYSLTSTNGTPHSLKKVGTLGAVITIDSPKTENPRKSTLNGTNNRSLPVHSKPWAGWSHQRMEKPLERACLHVPPQALLNGSTRCAIGWSRGLQHQTTPQCACGGSRHRAAVDLRRAFVPMAVLGGEAVAHINLVSVPLGTVAV
jgi:hypothetical protein